MPRCSSAERSNMLWARTFSAKMLQLSCFANGRLVRTRLCILEGRLLGSDAAAGHSAAGSFLPGRPHPHSPATPQLQIKFTRPVSGTNDFVAYIDAIGKLDGDSLFDRVENYIQPLRRRARWIIGARPAAGLLFLDNRHLRKSPRWFSSANDWWKSNIYAPQSPMNNAGVRSVGRRHHSANRVRAILAAQRNSLSAESVQHLPLCGTLPGQSRT